MIRYGLIQISDLQIGPKHRFGNPSNIVDALARDVNALSEKYSFIPIYLLLTGDITETAHANEFDEAGKVIQRLGKLINVDKDSIFSVPGNHDINWLLSKVSVDIGDPFLKYSNYEKFVNLNCNQCSSIQESLYRRYFDHRLGIEFLFLNSCEKEDHENHFGYVEKEKLIKSLSTGATEQLKNYTKICLCHHRVEPDGNDTSTLNNSYEVETILLENGYNILLTGHIHENRCHVLKRGDKSLIYSGAGSTGVNNSQRIDGIQNQYTIHVLDSESKKLESYWRAYSPNKRSQFGLGGWTSDNSIDTNPQICELPDIINFDSFSSNNITDVTLLNKFNIRRNPFTYSNAEKINRDQLIQLFVSSEGRNKSAVRLTGDAIIRGSRGSGKTMLLRYLEIFGNIVFDKNIREKKVSESFPVMINLSIIHSSEWKKASNTLINSAEKLIYESVITALTNKSKSLNSPEFNASLHRVKQKLSILNNQEGSIIWKLGLAIKENMASYFTHILVLIDEVAPVFPKEFFSEPEEGFLRWMNTIRNSGPYFTRIAVYPNDFSDILNEDRFGAVVNLDYNIKNDEDYLAYRKYCIELVNKYLNIVSTSPANATKISDIIEILEDDPNDSLEQLAYASDGSSRRFTSFMDKCLTSSTYKNGEIYNKEAIINIIKEFSSNLLSSYNTTDNEIAQSIAKACRKQITYRFRLPGLSSLVTSLHGKNEELNIVKLAEIGTGRRGTIYEFTYPYCLLMEVQTHSMKESRKICPSRDRITGEWISQVTTIEKNQIDYLSKELRIEGIITDINSDMILVTDLSGIEYLSESFDLEFKIGDKVSFIHINGIASDISK